MLKKPGKHILSKSTFIRGYQCPKSLYLYKHFPNLRDEITEQQQAVFERGTSVGELARKLFPGGVDASPDTPFLYQQSVAYTKRLIDEGVKIIYEATFQYDGVLAAIDILVSKNGKWKAYEVKSSTDVKEVNLVDAALQYYVITNSGIKLQDISIIHINNEYVRKGKINLKQLFTAESVLDEVLEQQEFVEVKIVELKKIINAKAIPKMDIGPHCSDPYDCDFMGHCWTHIPEVSVFNLARLSGSRKFEFYQKGIIELKDIPDDYNLTEGQQMQIAGCLKNKSFIAKNEIREFISKLNYPVLHLDFESFQTAVPMFDGTRPYQQVPFQYSLHQKKHPKEAATHSEFLAEANQHDPRIELIESLLAATAGKGTILAYNKAFEIGCLNNIAKAFPKYRKEIEKRIARIADLMVPFQKRWYYAPAMNGSYSIKAVLPALFPDLSYDSLAIADGSTASLAFVSLYKNPDNEEVQRIRRALIAYCKMDTLAMVRLLEFLEGV